MIATRLALALTAFALSGVVCADPEEKMTPTPTPTPASQATPTPQATVAPDPLEKIRRLEKNRWLDKIVTNPRRYANPTQPIILTEKDRQREISVGGAVRAPQRIAFTPDLTLLNAIAVAGGFNEFASKRKVRILRGKLLLRGYEVIVVDVTAAQKDPRLDVKLQPGDNVEVPENFLP